MSHFTIPIFLIFKIWYSEAFPTAFRIDDFDVVDQERSKKDIALAIGTSVSQQILQIVGRHQPEVLHVYLHAGSSYIDESKLGLFHNRGGMYSPLCKTTRNNSGKG